MMAGALQQKSTGLRLWSNTEHRSFDRPTGRKSQKPGVSIFSRDYFGHDTDPRGIRVYDER